MRQSLPVQKGTRILTFLEKIESLDQDIDEKMNIKTLLHTVLKDEEPRDPYFLCQ